MQSAIFSSEDREFMDAVNFDLNLFIKGNSLKSVKAVLVFPPFNNFKRFLVHKIVEDTYNSVGLSTFSIGQDFQRRIIVCHSALKLRLKTLQETSQIRSLADNKVCTTTEMIEKDVSKPRAAANIYRPPAARSPASVSDSKIEHNSGLKENRRSKVRRPDLQVYVPRPKRASFGEVEKSISPSGNAEKHVCSRRRKSDSLQGKEKCLSDPLKVEVIDAVDLTEDDTLLPASCSTSNVECEMSLDERVLVENISVDKSNTRLTVENKLSDTFNEQLLGNTSLVAVENKPSICESYTYKPVEIDLVMSNDKIEVNNSLDKQCEDSSSIVVKDNVCNSTVEYNNLKAKQDSLASESKNEPNTTEFSHEDMEDALTISDESQTATSSDEIISISSTMTESSSDDSSESSLKRKPVKKCKHDKVSSKSDRKFLKHEKTNDSSSYRRKDDEKNVNAEERNLKNRRILHGKPESDVLIISDSVESPLKSQNSLAKQDKLSSTSEKSRQQKVKEKSSKSSEKSGDKQSTYNPDNYEWDALFTDDGECLVPEFMEELTKNVGRVKITTAKSDYKPFQTEEERGGDGECIIEIYDFPAEFKTNDLLTVFAAYRNRGFHIKWVDDTHALGVFGSPLVADEVLATNLPFVKTRPLRQAVAESRIKARSLVLPPMERPKTCPALARRLVTGALGLRLPTASKEREAEKLVLKEAREKRRLDLKQREAVWEGNFN